jgi:hypothetical protein
LPNARRHRRVTCPCALHHIIVLSPQTAPGRPQASTEEYDVGTLIVDDPDMHDRRNGEEH